MVFAICASLRLARFNVMIDDPNRPVWAGNFFTGVPAPAGAIMVLLPIYCQFARRAERLARHRLTLLYTLAIAFLMVSTAAGVLRQAARHARAAGNGAAGLRLVVLFVALLISLSVVGADGRHGLLSRLACRSAGSPTRSISARTRMAPQQSARPPETAAARCVPRVSGGRPGASRPPQLARAASAPLIGSIMPRATRVLHAAERRRRACRSIR